MLERPVSTPTMCTVLEMCGVAVLGVITTSYPRWPGDYAGSFVRRALLDVREDRGVESTVVAPAVRPGTVDPGIRVVSTAAPGPLFSARGAPTAFRERPMAALAGVVPAVGSLAWGGFRACRAAKGLVGHWLVPGGALAMLVRRRRPVGIVVHSTAARWFLALPGRLRAPLSRYLRRATWLTATTPRLATGLEQALGRSVEVSPPAIDLGTLARVPRGGREGELILGFLGRGVAGKGVPLLGEVSAGLTAQGIAHRWLVAGPGVERGLPPDAQSLGTLRTDEVPSFFERIDALVVPSSPSRPEGVPCVMLEAMVARRPVFGFASGGMRDWMPSGWVTHADTASDLAALINARSVDRGALYRHARAHGEVVEDRLWAARASMSARLAGLADGRSEGVPDVEV